MCSETAVPIGSEPNVQMHMGFLAEDDFVDVRVSDELPIAQPARVKRLLRLRIPVEIHRIIRSAQEILRPYFCLIGQSRRRALSRLALSGQLLSGAKRC
jgi:hypothetical protein